MLRKKFGFTLAEVLITLGIIGIVAAMTIPNLMQKNQEKQTVAKLRAAQSILAQAIKAAEYENGTVDGWELKNDSASAIKIANYLKPTLKIAIDCGINDNNGHCVPNRMYKQLNGNNHGNYATSRRDCYKIKLLNGTSVWWRGQAGKTETRLITFWVDVNGTKMPNMYGKDLFVLGYENGGIRPLGAPDTNAHSTAENSCKLTGNGWGCAFYVLQNGNMNYLHPKKDK